MPVLGALDSQMIASFGAWILKGPPDRVPLFSETPDASTGSRGNKKNVAPNPGLEVEGKVGPEARLCLADPERSAGSFVLIPPQQPTSSSVIPKCCPAVRRACLAGGKKP